MKSRLILIVTILAAAAMPDNSESKVVSAYQKKAILSRAKVWRPVEVSKMDLLNGPGGEGSYKFDEAIACKYEEKDPKNPLGGHSPKFPCWNQAGTRLKVKYNNSEVYGEVAATRLFWALGFYAEKMYSVQIVCENCPNDPWTDDGGQKRATRTFKLATVQTRLQGETVGSSVGHGWTYDELEYILPAKGGSSRAEVDALKLLSVFVNHIDNTDNQQSLLCPPGDEKCENPIAYVTDLGGTFGGRSGSVSYRNWAKKNIWKEKKGCVAEFKGTFEGYQDPRISEAGRRFLADLLHKLSKDQIRNLFQGARFGIAGAEDYPIIAEGGKSRKVTVDDWVISFMNKRAEIQNTTCPE